MKLKHVVPLAAGLGLIGGASILAITKIRQLYKIISLQDETIDDLNELNQSLKEDLEEIENDLEFLEEHEVFIEYLKECNEKHLATIDNQRKQILQLEKQLKHFDGAVVARVIRKKTSETCQEKPRKLLSCEFELGTTSKEWQLKRTAVIESYLKDPEPGTEFVDYDWREHLKQIAEENKWEMDGSVLENVHNAIIFLNNNGFFTKIKNNIILEASSKFYNLLPPGSAIIAEPNGDPLIAIWEA